MLAWDDGTTDTVAAAAGRCDRTHAFARAGMYTTATTVTDDDGGSDIGGAMVVAYDPDAGDTNQNGEIASPAGAWAEHPAAAGDGKLIVRARYLPHDEGPAPGVANVHYTLRTGEGELKLQGKDLEWLVVTDADTVAMKGTATIHGRDGDYGFVAYGVDAPGAGPDSFRIVVWPLADGPVPTAAATYDSNRGADYDLDRSALQPLTKGRVDVDVVPPAATGLAGPL
jgi:hypothetical protein